MARKLLVVIWHLLHDRSVYYHLRPQVFVRKLQEWAWRIGRDDLPAASSAEFVRDRLKTTGLHDLAVALVTDRKGKLKVDETEELSWNENRAAANRQTALASL